MTEIVKIFEETGATFLADKSYIEPIDSFRHWYFEIRSEFGLTEMDILLTPNKDFITSFSVRFSILSPSTVIDQTFNFLIKLKSKHSIKIFDSDNDSRELELDIEAFKLNKDKVRKRQIVINNKTGLIIEGGSETTKYIHDNDLMGKIWNIN